jgi:hypothetical protein
VVPAAEGFGVGNPVVKKRSLIPAKKSGSGTADITERFRRYTEPGK